MILGQIGGLSNDICIWYLLRRIEINLTAPPKPSPNALLASDSIIRIDSILIPIMLGGKDSPWFMELIYSQFIVQFNWGLGNAFGFVLLNFSFFIV